MVLTVENKLDLTLGMLKERIKMLEECLQKYTTQCTAQEKKIDSLETEKQLLEQENEGKQMKLTMLEELFCELNHYDRDGSGGGGGPAIYYTNTMEAAVSAIEISAIGSKVVAKLIARRLGLIGTSNGNNANNNGDEL
mmetsp:Transcript_54738/g.61225  ORF Transcript_54738/g.61225 Transcript_54738/m.61225 type:complete len:138 (-) Transcript_54738:32-445(-)